MMNNMTKLEELKEMAIKALEGKGFDPKNNDAARRLLVQELDVVRITDSAEMFLAAADLCRNAKKMHTFLDPSSWCVGCMSILGYLLGICVDNPLRYPEYDSLANFEKGLRTRNLITFLCYDEGLDLMRRYLKAKYPNGKVKDYIDTFNIAVPQTDEYSSFVIHGALDYESSRRERTIDGIYSFTMQNVDVNDIPLDDAEAFDVFNSLDWNGVTDNVMFTTVMEEVKKHPAKSILQIWEDLNAPIYVVYGSKDNKTNSESYTGAIRVYQMAYLKAHYRDAFDATLETERTIINEPKKTNN